MSGSGAIKRARVTSIRAAKMKRAGATTREIAEALGITPQQVSARVQLGERLLTLVEPK